MRVIFCRMLDGSRFSVPAQVIETWAAANPPTAEVEATLGDASPDGRLEEASRRIPWYDVRDFATRVSEPTVDYSEQWASGEKVVGLIADGVDMAETVPDVTGATAPRRARRALTPTE